MLSLCQKENILKTHKLLYYFEIKHALMSWLQSLFQTLHFTHAESNENEKNLLFSLIHFALDSLTGHMWNVTFETDLRETPLEYKQKHALPCSVHSIEVH